jgi:hypothetical protein
VELRLRAPDTRALSERFDEVQHWIRNLEGEAGHQIKWVEANNRVLGRNRIPACILVPTAADAFN